MSDKRPHVAVARLGAKGDVLLTTPLLESIRKTHPNSRITYIVGKDAVEVLDYSPWINELIPWPDGGWRADLRMIRKIERMRFDMAFCLSPSPAIQFAFLAARSPIRVGFAPAPLAWMLTHRTHTAQLPQDLHRTQYYLAAARETGLVMPDPVRLHYNVTAAEGEEALMILNRWGVDPAVHRIVAIHPGTHQRHAEKRQWRADHFAAVARHASDKPGYKVVIFGGAAERGLIEQFASIPSPDVLDLTSTLSFREFAAVLSLCHLLVHNDSSPMHLATAVGVPVLSIFGHRNHHIWGPIGRDDRVIRRELPCSPCAPDFACDRSFECLRKLEAADVITLLDEILDQQASGRARAQGA